ncbi:hypothetical protein G8V05_00605 [Clostridium botulinum C/D]|nr:hypothetical protein CBC3_11000 [Clostridium botulinum V891]MCD3252642.1 hypothetical protein [Clostridium botulinum C/D]NFF31108.1 hypothetical protein [Clostridium botulinum]MCD3278351.1 hypothetical protein [Clostridium botulinum C/D]MCD3280716.1 hypothetical protein [Clostridium botulinum C/D]
MHKYKTSNINERSIVDLETFFKEIINIPSFMLSGNINLNAVMDSLWGEFDNLGEEKVAVI